MLTLVIKLQENQAKLPLPITKEDFLKKIFKN